MNNETSMPERVNNWIKNSVTLKLITITILMLLLLIPSSMIMSIIGEREALNNQTIAEVSSKWANSQQINGPILTIPLVYEYQKEDKTTEITKYWYILPENLKINGKTEPERLKRGIYEVVVYKAGINLSGNFNLTGSPDPNNLKTINYEQAFITIGISDLRGIKDEIKLKWQDENLKVEPGSKISNLIYSGVTVSLPQIDPSGNKVFNFEFDLNLKGSQNLSFIPLGKTTKVNLSSTWPSPSFTGNFLPDTRDINESGFTAEWKVLELNRNYPQSWIEEDQSSKIRDSAFGVNLINPLDDYQKSMRSAKYAAMTIALTFLVFFLVEIRNGRRIHPFQYALVGLALCVFYILLVAISEQTNFNFAYLIAMLSIVSMISLYSGTILKGTKQTILLTTILIGIYGFLFVTLQLADYALLMGSIGLTLILAGTMYFTRNINWYNLNRGTN